MPDTDSSVCIDPHPSFEDELLLSPKMGQASKNAKSKKRALESDAEEDEENHLQNIQERPHGTVQQPKQPKRSKRSKAASSSSTLPALFARQRQKASQESSSSSSVATRSEDAKASPAAVPFLDLNLVPPSPRKPAALKPSETEVVSTVNVTEKEDVTQEINPLSVDDVGEIPSTLEEDQIVLNPGPPQSSSPPATECDESEALSVDSQSTITCVHSVAQETMEVDSPQEASSSSEMMPPPPLPARLLQQEHSSTPASQTRIWKPGHQHSVSASFPMSPLTPLPPTPALGLKRKIFDVPTPSEATTATEPSRRKSVAPAPRMTRAATLRQQKVQQQREAMESNSPVKGGSRKEMDTNVDQENDNEASSSRGRSITRNVAASTAASRARSVTRTDAESSTTRRSITCPPTESPEKRIPSLPSFTFTSKPPLALAKHSESISTSPRKSFKLTVPSSLLSSPKKATSSRGDSVLSNLSRALEKLAVPPPPRPTLQSRPSTSLGFSHDGNSASTSREGGTMHPPRPFVPMGSGNNKDKVKSTNLFGKPTSSMSSSLKSGGLFSSRLGRGGNPFSKPLQQLQHARAKASKATSLETVQGSPVKGGSSVDRQIKELPDEIHSLDDDDEFEGGPSSKRPGGSFSSDPIQDSDELLKETEKGTEKSTLAAPPSDPSADGPQPTKEMKQISQLYTSRRASMAFTSLERSLKEQGVGLGHPSPASSSLTSPKDPSTNLSGGKQRSTSATVTTMSGRTVRPPPQFRSFTASVTSPSSSLSKTNSEPSIAVSSSNKPAEASSSKEAARSPFDFDFDDRSSDTENGSGSGPRKRPKKMPGSLSVLDGCTIFVDVRTEEGDDASDLFVDMLQGLGAKILTRGVGQTCTHVVYKNGLPSTISKVRLMDEESRPLIVGIGWVVDCAEKRERADETKFTVDIEGMHVAGAAKRRKSVQPRPMAITSGPMDAFLEFSRLNKSGESSELPKERSTVLDLSTDDETESNTSSELGSKNTKLMPLDLARRRGSTASRPT